MSAVSESGGPTEMPLNPSCLRAAPLTVLLALTACGGSTSGTDVEDPVPTTLELSDTSLTFELLGQGRTVTATIRDQSGDPIQETVTWTTQDAGVASVSDAGVVRAVQNGTTVVTASVASLSATVDVTVEQVPSVLRAVSGDDQQGLAGTELPEPLVAVVRDRGGAPVEGVEVTFTPGPNSGSVDPASGISGADGTVSTTWTLDAKFGPQTVIAATELDDAEFSAFGGSDTPTPDMLLSDLIHVERSDPTTLDAVTVTTTVQNQGDGDATGFRVQLLVDDTEVASVEIAGLSAAAEQEVSLDVPPMNEGVRSLELVIDPDDTVLELDEANNTGTRDLLVELQQVIEPGTTVSALSADAGERFLFRADVAGPTSLTVELSGGSGDVDLWIARGERPLNLEDYVDCVSAGPTMEETCQFPEGDGRYHIAVYAPENTSGPSGFTNSSLTVTVGDPVVPFDLEVELVDSGTVSQNQAFLDAAAVWGTLISGDIPDFDLGDFTIPANECIDGQPSINGIIDDVIIFIAIRSIDGPNGTLARAGPCFVRHGSSLPFVGTMEFDEADVEILEDNGDLGEVVLHEMGHVLGFGTIWRVRDLLRASSTEGSGSECTVSDPEADTYFRGELAIQAFDAAGGVDYQGQKVPVANGELDAGCGSADGHWRESVMQTELMTPFLNSLQANPLSAITVQSMADLGYPVDIGEAEAYTLPATQQQFVAPAPVDAQGSSLIDLGDDLYRGPVWVMEQGGRVVRILR